MWSCNFHGIEAWSTFFLLINLSVYTMLYSRDTQSDQTPRKGQAMVTVVTSSCVVSRRRYSEINELMTTRIVSHRIGKHAHPFETIQTPGEISPKTHLMGAKIGTKMGTFTRRAGCPKRARGYKIVRGNQPLFLLFFFPGHLLYPITVRNEWSMVVNLDVL